MLKLADTQKFYGFDYQGRTFDCGSKAGFIEANVAFALWRKDIRPSVEVSISELLETIKPA
jgi:UTP--glucose-1-phosphate uridylyltransferase